MMRSPSPEGRAGVILPLAALLLVVILAMAAFVVDIGYMIAVQSELQNATDASALAGAAQLMQPYVQYSNPNQTTTNQATILSGAMTSARLQVQKIAGLNKAGDVPSLSVNDSDIVFGFLDAQNNFSPTPPDSRFPNSVQVTLRRDDQANTPLGLVFAPIFGKSSADLTTTARATIMASPNNFSFKFGNLPLLPVALDVRIWNQFLQDGTSPSANNQVLTGPNGAPELQVYPDAPQFGKFGLASIGPPANNAPTYRTWIDTGASSTDVQYLDTNGLLPVSPTTPQYWHAGPGIKSTLQTNFLAAIVGQPRLIPLYDGSLPQTGGFPIIGFGGVAISQATARGTNMNISVQPTFVYVPQGIGGTPAGTSTLPTFSFGPVQLTR